MSEIFITITGPVGIFDTRKFRVDLMVKLKKEPDNPVDDEAIKIILPGGIHAGYVANSVHTVARGTYSAGRLYDKFNEVAYARVKFITQRVAIAEFLGYSEELERKFASLEEVKIKSESPIIYYDKNIEETKEDERY